MEKLLCKRSVQMVDALQLVEHRAPGQAWVRQLYDAWGLNSLCSNLLKDLSDANAAKTTLQKVYRDFPKEGETNY